MELLMEVTLVLPFFCDTLSSVNPLY